MHTCSNSTPFSRSASVMVRVNVLKGVPTTVRPARQKRQLGGRSSVLFCREWGGMMGQPAGASKSLRADLDCLLRPSGRIADGVAVLYHGTSIL